MKTRITIILALLGVFSCTNLFADGTPEVWTRGFTAESLGMTGLHLVGVAQTSEGLSGIFVYYNSTKDNARTEPVVIAGFKARDGVFWANATVQVRKNAAAEWETIGKAGGNDQGEQITVAPYDARTAFNINFDSLKPFVSTHKIGRVIISSGATAEFTLEALMPPAR